MKTPPHRSISARAARTRVPDPYHTPPSHILEGLPSKLAPASSPAHPIPSTPSFWHITFWLGLTLDWCHSQTSPYPTTPGEGFPTAEQTETEPWPSLCDRFQVLIAHAARLTEVPTHLQHRIECPSRPGEPTRTMTVEEQLISLAAHNAYHFGRIVLLRQILGTWPPPSGGFTW